MKTKTFSTLSIFRSFVLVTAGSLALGAVACGGAPDGEANPFDPSVTEAPTTGSVSATEVVEGDAGPSWATTTSSTSTALQPSQPPSFGGSGDEPAAADGRPGPHAPSTKPY